MKDQQYSIENIDVTQLPTPHYVKFAFLCTNKRNVPKWIGFFCFIMNQLQTLAVIIKNADIALPEDVSISASISKFYTKIFISSEWHSNKDKSLIFYILIIFAVYIFLILLFAIYLHLKLIFKNRISSFLQTLWSSLLYLHTLGLFFPIHSFTLEALKLYFQEDLFIEEGPAILALLIFILIINSISIGSSLYFYVMIKTKDLLSSKNNFMLRWDQGFKTVISILWIFAANLEWLKAAVLIASFITLVFRDFGFFYILPYYRIPILELSALIQAPMTSLALITLVAKILSEVELYIGKSFVMIAWLVLTPLVMIVYYNYLWYKFKCVLLYRLDQVNLYQISHKRYLIRYLMKKRIEPHKEMRKFDWYYFLYLTKISQFLSFQGLSYSEFTATCQDDKKFLLERVKHMMIATINKYPSNELNKINLAYFYIKYDGSHLLAYNLIDDMFKVGPSFSVYVSLIFIGLELKKKLYLQYSHQEENSHSEQCQGLNIMKYVEVKATYAELKKQIAQQIKLQTNFWNHFVSTKPDMGILTNICSKIHNQKLKVEKSWNKFCRVNDQKFSLPLLVYGFYSCFVNNDSVTGEKYLDDYHINTMKYNSLTQRDELTDNTLFSEDNVQLIMSGLKTRLGRVLDCSCNIYKIFGWKKEFLISKSINMIMSPFYRDRHDEFLLTYYNTGNTKILNQTVVLPVLDCNGYVKQAWIHVKISPSVESGLFFVGIMRPVKNKKLVLLVGENGIIDGIPKEFAEDMNITEREIEESYRIFDFCPDFHLANEVFNEVGNKIISERTSALLKHEMNVQKHRTKDRKNTANLHNHVNHGILDVDKLQLKRSKGSSSKSAKRPSNFENKIHDVFENFTSGSNLIFYPHGSFRNKHKKGYNKKIEPIIYKVRIQNKIYGKDFIKEVSLERVSNQEIENNPDYSLVDHSALKMHNEKDNNKPMTLNIKDDNHTPHIILDNSNILSQDGSSEMSDLDEKQAYSKPKEKDLKLITKEDNHFHNHQLDETPTYRGQETISLTIARGDTTARLLTKRPELHHDEIPDIEYSFRNNIAGEENLKTNLNHANFFEKKETNSHRGPSSIEVHDHIQKRDYSLKMKLKKLKEKLNHGILDLGKAENSMSSSYLSRGTKVQGLITQALQVKSEKRSASVFKFSFLVFLFIALSLNIAQMLSIQLGIKGIQIKTSVIEKGFLRTKTLLRYLGTIRFWDGELNGYYTLTNWKADNELFRSATKTMINEMSSLNDNLWSEVGKMDKISQHIFYRKDVRMYERQEDDSFVLISTDSNFEAIQKIIYRGLAFCNKYIPDVYSGPVNTDDLTFILDNSFNDLLVTSENSVEILLNDLYKELENVKFTLILLSGINLCGAVIFLIGCLRYLIIMRKSSESFMFMFFRLDLKCVQETKSVLKNFADSLESNMVDFEFSEENEKQRSEIDNNIAKSQNILRKASMHRLFRNQLLLFAKILPTHLLFIGWYVGYLFIALNIISNLSSNQVQIQYSLETQNRQELLSRELVEILVTNSTGNMRNRPIQEDFLINLNAIQNSEEMLQKFKGGSGSLTASQEQIFFDFPCDAFAPGETTEFIELKTSCSKVSKGTERVSLIRLNADLFTASRQVFEAYNTSAKSTSDINNLYLMIIATTRDITNVAGGLLVLLHRATSISFLEKAEKMQDEALNFTCITVVLCIVFGIILWNRVIKKIIAHDAKDRLLLQLVPIKQILSNRYLKQQLVQNSNGSLDGVKRFI